MSGFVAILHADGQPIDTELLGRMTVAMSHCGPDGQDTWLGEGIGLGHALLGHAPEPPAGERQPRGLDDRIWIAADARVDGRAELAAALRSPGRDVTPETDDAELILHAYDAWGERCVEHLVGDFAFAIWDGSRRRLFCARDHFGVVPLYYARVPGGIALGNSLRALRLHPGVSDALNERAIGDFLVFHCNMDLASTTFDDILALPPAHALTWEDGTMRIRRYWEPPQRFEEVRHRRPQAHVERFRALFDHAVADRLRADRAGTHLSGGMDSTSVAATAHAVLTSRGARFDLRAYTMGWDQFVADEEPRYAEQVAARLGIPLDQVASHDYLTRPPDGELDWAYPEPCVIPNQSPHYEMARRISSFARVQLTGFGGDPLFSVPSARPSSAAEWRDSARDAVVALRSGRVPRYGVRTALRRRLGRERRALRPMPAWIEPGFARRTGLETRWRELQAEWQGVADHRVMLHPFWPAVFTWSHPTATGLHLRSLFPFFDLRLVQHVWETPLYPWRQDKHVLRCAMRGRLPEQVLRRPKTPFYRERGESDEGDPRYRLALLPETRRWRAGLMTGAIGEYVDLERMRALIESPEPGWSLSVLDTCFTLAHWLESERSALQCRTP